MAPVAADTPGVAGEVFNVATHGRISLNELLAVLNGIMGTKLEAVYGPARTGDVRDSQADISKAQQRLGYRPTVSLEEGLRQTVAWFRASRA